MNTGDKDESLTLEILEAIEEKDAVTQRDLAERMGVALGLANSYLKRCIKKGFVKIHTAPANRYLYYLTPTGFAEKSRLTAMYLSYSLNFYRKSVNSFDDLFFRCNQRGWTRILLCGESDLAEIAELKANFHKVTIIASVPSSQLDFSEFEEFDAFIVTDLEDPASLLEILRHQSGDVPVLVPDVLGLGLSHEQQINA